MDKRILSDEELLGIIKKNAGGGGGGGTTNYNQLENKPQIAGTTLSGNKSLADLGIASATTVSGILDGASIGSFADVETALAGKQDTLTFDDVPTANSNNPVKSGGVKSAIDAAVSSAYHHAGTKTCEELVAGLLVAANEGNVYNMTDSGTTTADFIEGAGQPIKAGDNVGIAKISDGVYKFDLLSGFVDTSNFVQKSVTAGLLKNDGTVNDEIEGDVDSLKSGFTNLDNEVNGDATVYPYADVITIEDAVPSNLADCKVKIEPVQDLHGQSAPYVGGASKNKLPLVLADIKSLNTDGTWSGDSYTFNGITYTVNTDDAGNVISIDISGTATARAYLIIANNLYMNNGSYKLNGYAGGGSITSGAAFYFVYSSAQANPVYVRDNDGASMTIDNDYVTIVLNVGNGYEIPSGGITCYPMLRLATETDATFAPYTNICPISGHTEVDVQRDGVNLFDVSTVELHKSINNDGLVYPTENYNLSDYIRVSGTKLIVSGDNKDKNISFGFYDKNKNWFNFASSVSVNTAVTIPNGTAYVRFDVYKDSENIQLELGQTATTYEPFRGKTYTIALGSTIYGGTVDFDSGVMTVTKTCVDMGILSWSARETDTANVYRMATNVSPYPKPATSSSATANIICSIYRRGSNNDTYNKVNGTIAIGTAGLLSVYDERYTGLNDTSAFASAVNGQKLCYELATPLTVQLTPQQIQLLKGQNTLTASTGQISVTVNGVSGSIGAVQEQVNELAEEVSGIVEYSETPVTIGKWIDGKFVKRFVVVKDSPVTLVNNNWVSLGITPPTDAVRAIGVVMLNSNGITMMYGEINMTTNAVSVQQYSGSNKEASIFIIDYLSNESEV